MSRPPRGMTPERAMHLVQDLRAQHLAARASDCSLVECAKILREAEMLEKEVHVMRAKCAERDGRIAKCALNNPEISLQELGERFGIHWSAIGAVLQRAGITKGVNGVVTRWEKKP